jgi:hydroxymethylpyrimidine/phosphomethylpyrimidine kinase
MSNARVPVAVTIAGSDSSAGAGIQADLKTFAALGVYGTCAITALTAQNTLGVRAIHVVPAEFVARQIEAVFDDFAVRATKIGMLPDRSVIEVVSEILRSRAAENVVLDPVMIAKDGARLFDLDAVGVLKERLVPLARVLTPNLAEAAILLGESQGEIVFAPQRACQRLLELGPRSVVLKGGHAGGAYSEDLYFDGENWMRLPARRIATENTHGTGCTFASAIAAELAKGAELPRAVAAAKSYVTDAIQRASEWKLGRGNGPLHHFHASWPE